MWTREKLKHNAKHVLSKQIWMPVLICVLVALLEGGRSGVKFRNFNHGMEFHYQIGMIDDSWSGIQNQVLDFFAGPFGSFIIGTTILFIVIGILLSFIFRFFVVNPVKVGKAKAFLDGVQGTTRFEALFYAFSNHYLNIVKVMAIKDIKIALWTLLLVVPGIVKLYEYSMIEYILAEHADMEANDVFEKTRSMTLGQKKDIFILDLSFIGWHMAAVLTCGFGYLLLNPYIAAVYAQLYCELKYA